MASNEARAEFRRQLSGLLFLTNIPLLLVITPLILIRRMDGVEAMALFGAFFFQLCSQAALRSGAIDERGWVWLFLGLGVAFLAFSLFAVFLAFATAGS